MLRGDASGDAFEYPLYSDTSFVSELRDGYGPYQVLNAVRPPQLGSDVPALYLRVEVFLKDDLPRMDKTDADRYHGGSIQDEIAALLSLSLGCRLKSGGATRWFRLGGDPRGWPYSFGDVLGKRPALTANARGTVLPRASAQRVLEDASRVKRLPDLDPRQAVALVRCARMYQEAVWVAENDPELAWLLLVSAVETAANQWRADTEAPLERLRASRPEVEELLKSHGFEVILEPLAELLAPYLGSTKKFVDFLITFLPAPPAARPPSFAQVPWAVPDLRGRLRTVYQYRSRALHAGTPFPGPMCIPPQGRGPDAEEKPLGLAAAMLGGVWVEEDLPMMLHTFEFLAHGALLRWWDAMLTDAPAPGAAA